MAGGLRGKRFAPEIGTNCICPVSVHQASESRLGLPSLHGCLEFPCDMNLLPVEVRSSPLDIR